MAPLMSTAQRLKKNKHIWWKYGASVCRFLFAFLLHSLHNLKHFVAFLVLCGSQRPVRVPLGYICKIKLLPLSPSPGDGTPPGVIAALEAL